MSTPTEKFDAALGELNTFEELASRDTFLHTLHPGSKLLVTILFILTAVSFPKENLSGLLALTIYPLVLFQVADLSLKRALYRCRFVLPLVCAVGIANPFLDRRPFLTLGSFCITYGLLSMLTLML
ncbi:MAG: cobalt ECF transporter T component CbiQ, partial [Blautia sp.]|nr:cobalt ECF transporter T component CbiQ [Blautia sp.]